LRRIGWRFVQHAVIPCPPGVILFRSYGNPGRQRRKVVDNAIDHVDKAEAPKLASHDNAFGVAYFQHAAKFMFPARDRHVYGHSTEVTEGEHEDRNVLPVRQCNDELVAAADAVCLQCSGEAGYLFSKVCVADGIETFVHDGDLVGRTFDGTFEKIRQQLVRPEPIRTVRVT